MARKPIDERLASVPLFAHLSRSELKAVSRIATPLQIEAGRTLMREGEMGKELVLIVSGEADIMKGDTIVSTRGPGTFLGEISLLLDRPRTATVVARTDMEIETIECRQFRALLSDNPSLYDPLLKAVGERLDELQALDH